MTDLTAAAGSVADAVTASPSARTVSGRLVPYGPVGQTSQGRLTFSPGSLTWTDPRRVKLLLEHDQKAPVGFATELEERPDGLYGTFSVPEGAAGDAALLEASHGLRDAFSVGVQVDDAVATRLRRAQGAPVAGAGALREVSLVSVPAFDDARVSNVAAAAGALVVSSWTTATVPLHEPTVPDHDHTDPAPAEPEHLTPAPEEAPMTETVETAPTAPVQQEAPAIVTAAAGSALITAEPPVYTFDGNGPSLVQDARTMMSDPDAAARFARFNSELATGNPGTYMALAAVHTRTGDLSELVDPTVRRPDLLLRRIDLGRPVWNRLNPIRIDNAQPFRIPVEGTFTGVGPHTEGTAHVAEGTMTFADVTLTPRAVSGAFRMSRELLDSSSPAADQLVVRAMLANYAEVSEALAVAGLVAGAGAAVANVDTVNELSRELLAYYIATRQRPAAVIAGGGFYTALSNDMDTTNRRQLPSEGPSNAAGTRDGITATVDGVPLILAPTVATDDAFILPAEGVFVGESPVQTFRFDEPEGPGIIKLALFAYQVAAVTRAGSVRRLTRAL